MTLTIYKNGGIVTDYPWGINQDNGYELDNILIINGITIDRTMCGHYMPSIVIGQEIDKSVTFLITFTVTSATEEWTTRQVKARLYNKGSTLECVDNITGELIFLIPIND